MTKKQNQMIERVISEEITKGSKITGYNDYDDDDTLQVFTLHFESKKETYYSISIDEKGNVK